MASKPARAALMVARRMRAPGGSLSDAISSFSRDREANLNRPASGGSSDAALLAALQQHPQLAVAEQPPVRRQQQVQGANDLGTEIDEGAKWLSGQSDGAPPITPAKSASPSLVSVPSGAPGAQSVATPSAPAGGDLVERTKYGLAGVESSGWKNPYVALGPVMKNGDRAYGKYQVMGSNIPAWTKAATGTALTPSQFYNNPDAQERTASDQIGKILAENDNDPNQAASVWFTGKRLENVNPKTSDGYTTNEEYQKRFSRGFNSYAPPSQSADAAPPATPARGIPPHSDSPPGYGPFGTNAKPDFAPDLKFDPNNTEDKNMPAPQPAPQADAPPPAALGPQSQAAPDPTGSLYNKVAFGPDVQAGYDNPQVMFDPDAAQAKRGGYMHRATGGEIDRMPTDELIAYALNRIRKRRDVGGALEAGIYDSTYGSSSGSRAGGNPGGSGQGEELMQLLNGGSGGSTPQQPTAAPTTPNFTPAIASGTVGNAAPTHTGSPIGGVPNASPIPPSTGGGSGASSSTSTTNPSGPQYNNTLDQALGTNNPTMNDIFGFNYPTIPPPSAQPTGPVPQALINNLYGFGGGSQEGTGSEYFNSGGAIVMDAALNTARKAIKGKKR